MNHNNLNRNNNILHSTIQSMTSSWIFSSFLIGLVILIYTNRQDVQAFHLGSVFTISQHREMPTILRLDANHSPQSALCYKLKSDEDGSEKTDIEGRNRSHPNNKPVEIKRVTSTTLDNHSYIVDIRCLKDWENFIEANRDKLISVRFYSHVCKSCMAITPYYYRLAKRFHNKAVFVDIPMTKDNIDLQLSFNVTKVPYGHIYAPGNQLIEERSLGKASFKYFERILYSYIMGVCDIEDFDFSNPYIVAEEQREQVDLTP